MIAVYQIAVSWATKNDKQKLSNFSQHLMIDLDSPYPFLIIKSI